MTDRPILFSSSMVRALLADRKTQTRRILKPQPTSHVWRHGWSAIDGATWSDDTATGKIPIWAGDRLWVREAFSYDHLDIDHDGFLPAWYWADGNPEYGDWTRPKPSIHMPRKYSRLTLIVTDVQVERLQDCSAENACAEGALVPPYTEQFAQVHAVDMYRCIWNGINGLGAWESNPWIVAYSFTVIKQNIDEVL